MTQGDVTRFGAVDAQPDPDFFIGFLDGMSAVPSIRRSKEASFRALRLAPGHRVLEVGCGTGDDARRMAAEVGRSGRVIGIDVSDIMLAEARRRAGEGGLPVEFRLGDAGALPFPDAGFDAVRVERVLIHLADPAAAVREMARVTRPGGRVVLCDVDFDTLTIAHPDPGLVRRMVALMTDGMTSGTVGRHLPALLLDAGLVEIEVEGTVYDNYPYDLTVSVFAGMLSGPVAAGAITEAEVARFWSGLEEIYKTDRFLVACICFIGAATKPE